jgi:hypothetical protein
MRMRATEPVAAADPLIQQLSSQPFTALLGGAGTGKTFLAKAWLESAHIGTLQLCATTGIAAVNLGAGTTINSFLKYFKTEHLVDLYTSGLLTAKLRKYRRAGLERILLDEVSMMDANQLTVIVRAIEEVNAGEGIDEFDPGEDEDLPPLGLTLIGDFCQLPPVKAPFAFESIEWPKFAVTTLDRIWRQSDPAFVEALRAARRGDGRAAQDTMASCFHPVIEQAYEGPTVLAKNDAVERYNRLRMDALHSTEASLPSSRWGDQRGEWKQIPEVLQLKEGALVMLLANCYDPEELRYRYVNGDLGEFLGMEGGQPIVRLQRTGLEEPIVAVDREVTAPLEVGERKALKAAGEAHLIKAKSKLLGGIRYSPIRVAYATTVHKSQGLSLDKVQVNLREGFMGSSGMCYVGLSRARSLAGLRIVGDARTFVARCTVDPRVVQWI